MARLSSMRLVVLFTLVAACVLTAQALPRLLPFDLVRVSVFGLPIHTDYLMHALLFMAIVLVASFLQPRVKMRVLLTPMLAIAFIAEVIQLYIPQRTFNWYDLVSNVAGVIVGVVIAWAIRRLFSPRSA